MANPATRITRQQIATYQKDGAIFLPGLFSDWVETIAAGIERNMREPGPGAAENTRPAETGRFFDDYCNWTRIPEFEELIFDSVAAKTAAVLMQSERVQIFHDHVLVKEAGTARATPWHQDAPYYFVDGAQTVSFWIPVDPVDKSTLRLIAGSHKWQKPVLPTRWLSEKNFYPDTHEYQPVPDPDAEPEKYSIVEWPMQPGDAIAFDYKTVHGARGNLGTENRRALSLRFVGDDARYVDRAGPTSPPYPGHGMQAGQRLREDWFPFIELR
ncbi:MAG: phytanoyl-CoA dioxygenase [Gammaproteobacteria bacterium]|nr:phytanoyl-CoA dioxygenase [Gammaproteobacteria bacterium]